MKPETRNPFSLTVALLGCCSVLTALPSKAETLFTDNYDATENAGPTDQTDNPGRQGGTLAPLLYLQRGNVQIGNTGTLTPSPGNDPGDELLTAFGGVAMIDHDFSDVTAPLEISWLGLISTISAEGTQDWTSLIIGTPEGVPYVNGANADSILIRANGGTQIFDHGSPFDGVTGPETGLDTWTQYKVILSDLAGTGSAFADGGSRLDYYVNGTFVGTSTVSQLMPGEGYIGFSANRINGYDNVSISTVTPGTGNSYTTWAAAKGLDGTPGKENGPTDDPDKDGVSNVLEFAFNGNPLSGSDRGKVFTLTADSDYNADPSAAKELILTIAVRSGTPAFSGTTAQIAVIDGTTYTVAGSLDLVNFTTAVHPVTPITADLPSAGEGYEYRSFSLGTSDGLTGKGFLRAEASR